MGRFVQVEFCGAGIGKVCLNQLEYGLCDLSGGILKAWMVCLAISIA